MRANDWITLIASIGALVFSLLNYRRSSRFDNSNHLYKLKIDIYTRLLGELNSLLDTLGDHIVQAKLHLKEPDDSISEKLEKSADEVDKIIFNFDNFITSNSLVIPKNVLSSLQEFSSYLLDSELESNDEVIDMGFVTKLDKLHNELLLKGNSINEIIREDLHVEKLNAELYRRLK